MGWRQVEDEIHDDGISGAFKVQEGFKDSQNIGIADVTSGKAVSE